MIHRKVRLQRARQRREARRDIVNGLYGTSLPGSGFYAVQEAWEDDEDAPEWFLVEVGAVDPEWRSWLTA